MQVDIPPMRNATHFLYSRYLCKNSSYTVLRLIICCPMLNLSSRIRPLFCFPILLSSFAQLFGALNFTPHLPACSQGCFFRSSFFLVFLIASWPRRLNYSLALCTPSVSSVCSNSVLIGYYCYVPSSLYSRTSFLTILIA